MSSFLVLTAWPVEVEPFPVVAIAFMLALRAESEAIDDELLAFPLMATVPATALLAWEPLIEPPDVLT